jgi:hypothetical protein
LRLLIARAELTTASVSTIVRQTNAEYREAVQLLSEGKSDAAAPKRGLNLLERRGRIFTYEDPIDRFSEAAKKIASLVKSGESHITIAPTHREIAPLTAAIRQELIERGMIKPEVSLKFSQLRNRSLHAFEKKVSWLHREGDTIELVRDTAWGKRGERFRITNADSESVTIDDSRGQRQPLVLEDAAAFETYEPSSVELAVGDRIRITKSAIVDGRIFCAGELLTINGFDRDGNLELDSGRLLPKDFGHLDYRKRSTRSSSSTTCSVASVAGSEPMARAMNSTSSLRNGSMDSRVPSIFSAACW